MNTDPIHDIVEKQRAFFLTGQTLDLDFHFPQHQKLKTAVIRFMERGTASALLDNNRKDVIIITT